ncbi:uncharacterized protein LOC130899476 [Diorhabda carinulata]|uniref:uncharacterized protein LOC130899476 n=1 Tax=Diorhabda carinulata TaxID=1163345 RepID=UPI0025A08819|nr:uncharacterized protein LOC130899476 [Diorhabda carinulata]
MYIYDLPYTDRDKLCQLMDKDNKWQELGGVHMKYDILTLEEIKRISKGGSSPTSELLNIWGHQNHTVLELFVLLHRMKQYQSMILIKNFVDKKYHVLIKDGVGNLDPLTRQKLMQTKKTKNIDYKINLDNYEGFSEKIINSPIVPQLPEIVTNENNESVCFPLPKSPVNFGRSKVTASDISIVAESVGGIPSIPYEELQKSTNNWDEKTVLGKGGFGKVYKGTWKCTQVAIKRLDQKDQKEYETEQIKQSITELHCLNAYRHDNILPLYGYSIGGPHPCLVYQYMAGGSLDNRLRTKDAEKLLNWPQRLNVAIGVARGLQFLHTNMINRKPLVHGDIKSANILLDPCNQPRIGDFGLAREGPQSHYTYIKLKTMYVYLFTPEGVIIETYRFDLKYNKDSNFSYKTEDKKTPEEVFTATIFFLKGVNKLGTLDKLDETTKLDIEMLLTNDCPDDYRPPYFHKSDNPIHNTIQNYTLLGQITTGFHKLSSRCSGLKLPLESIKKVSKTTLDLNENTFDMDIESVQNSQVIYTQEQYDTAYSTVNYGQYRKDYEVLNILDDSEEEEQQQQEAEDVVKACPKKRFDNSNITVSDRVETSIESNIGISCICKLEAPGFISIIRCAQCEQPFHAPCYDCFTDNPNFVFTCLDCRSADKNIPVSLVKETSLKAKMRIILLCLMKIGAIPKGILNSINPEDEQWIIQKMISSNLCEPETKSLSNCLVLWPKVDTFLEVLTNDKRISIQNLFH